MFYVIKYTPQKKIYKINMLMFNASDGFFFFSEGCTVLQKDYDSHYESCARTGQIRSSTLLRRRLAFKFHRILLHTSGGNNAGRREDMISHYTFSLCIL